MNHSASEPKVSPGFFFRHDVVRVFAFALVYFLAHQVAFLFPDRHRVLMVFWPAAGVGLSVFLLNRRHLWPMLCLALFIAGLGADLLAGRGVAASVGFMVANLAESVLCAIFIFQLCGPGVRFARIREVLALIGAATIVNAGTAILGAGTATLTGASAFGEYWLTWWVASGLGILLITALVITWKDVTVIPQQLRNRHLIEAGLFVLLWSSAVWLTFHPALIAWRRFQPPPYLVMALLAWPALRFGQRGVTFALALLAAAAVTGTAAVPGLLDHSTVAGFYNSIANDRLLHAQLFVASAAITGLLLAASKAETRASEKKLEIERSFLENLLHNIPDRLWLKDPNGVYIAGNHGLEQFLARKHSEIIGKTDFEFFSAAQAESYRASDMATVAAGATVEHERVMGQGGRTRIVETIRTQLCDGSGQLLGILGITRDITELKEAEQVLQERVAVQEQLETTASLLPGALISYHEQPDGSESLAYGSPAFEDVWGLRTNELKTDLSAMWKMIDTVDRDRVREALGRSSKSSTEFHEEFRIRHPQKGEVWLAMRSRPVPAASGGLLWHGFAYDITERKRAEEAVRHNENGLRAVVRVLQSRAETVQQFLDKSLDEAVSLTGSKIGYIFFYDEDRHEFILNSWSKDVMKECALVDAQTCYELSKTGLWGEVVRQRRAIMVNQFENPNPWKKGLPEGHVAVHRFLTLPVFSSDRIVAVIGVGNKDTDYDETDVLQLQLLMSSVWKSVEVRRAEQHLREANQQYATLVNCIPDVIWSMDLQGRFTFVSPNIERTHGWTVKEIREMNFRETVARDEVNRHELMLQDLLERASCSGYDHSLILCFESEQLRKDGSTFWAEISATLQWSDDGKPVGLTGVTRDISDRVKARREQESLQEQLVQAQKMESIGRLAGGIAHDFNNLLSVINGYSEMLLDELRDGDPVRRKLQQILNAGERATGLTQQLLAFSRKQMLQPRRLNLNSLIEEMRSMLERLVGEDVNISVALNKNDPVVHADPNQLQQVIMNLVVNARDAMPRGGCLTIETGIVEVHGTDTSRPMKPKQGRYALLAIADTGVGMDELTQARIFEPFFTTKPIGQGTGLGLSTVQGIVGQSGGYIDVSSEPGRGTTFNVYLPTATEAAVQKDSPSARTGTLGGDEMILVVEDQTEVREFAVDVLTAHGYRVLQAATPREAIAVFERDGRQINLVLTDVVMPGMSGRELVERIRNVRPDVKSLFMSGYTDDVMVRHGVLAEAITLIQKPLSPDRLVATVQEALRKSDSGAPE